VTELGAWGLRPLLCERAGVLGAERTSGNVKLGRQARMERIAAAALKQSQRTFRLRILEPLSIQQMESHMQQACCSLLADSTGPPLLTLLPRLPEVRMLHVL
jgi:16S rRNA U1498 N3-methylase RsmE